MIRNKNTLAYTEEDKNNLCVRKYTSDEMAENTKTFNNKRNSVRIKFLISLVILILLRLTLPGEATAFFLNLALIFWIFVACLNERIGRIDSKANSREYYVEIRLIEKLPSETENSGSMGNRTVQNFYPVIGEDTTTGFKSKFYISMEDYLEAEVGTSIRINQKNATLF